MKFTAEAVASLTESLLECDGNGIEASGVKGENKVAWIKKFKNHEALKKWAEGTDGVEVHAVRVLADEENPANDLDESAPYKDNLLRTIDDDLRTMDVNHPFLRYLEREAEKAGPEMLNAFINRPNGREFRAFRERAKQRFLNRASSGLN